MPYLTAHFLDRCNEQLVHWRLRGRHRAVAAGAASIYLQELKRTPGDPGDGLEPLRPVQRAGGLWEAPSPWISANGRNARWVAELVPAATRTGQAAPAMILLHGWLMDRPQRLVYRSWARRLARRGVDVWLPRLPHHLERAEPGEVSGQRCLSPDVPTSLDAVRQAVAETRLLARWLRNEGVPAVALWGMSLGGWVAALSATVDGDWDAVALWAPVAVPAEVLWESRLALKMRDAVRAGGIDRADLEGSAIDVVTPARRDAVVPRDRILLVGAAHDQVISPRSLARLSRRWNVDVRWVAHGHISLMASRRPVRDTVDFVLAALGDAQGRTHDDAAGRAAGESSVNRSVPQPSK